MTAPANASRLKRNFPSWLKGYLEYTEGVSSPKLFRKWMALVTIGACLERRVWIVTSKGFTFANLFVILVGRPGIGKSEAIRYARDLIRATKSEGIYEPACNLAPVDVTKSALYDYLASKSVRRLGPDPEREVLGLDGGEPYHSCFLAVSELSDLIRDHDTQLLGALHGLYDCISLLEEERRYRKDDPIKIPRPQASLIGGTTPAYISRTFPPSAWDEGFMARTILIYSSEFIEPDLFTEEETDPMIARHLVEDLRAIGRMSGKMEFTPECKEMIKGWQKAGKEPKPAHLRLEHYNTRRMRHALKLSMIAAADRSNGLDITPDDFQQALAWMHEAENVMPQIFMEMTGTSHGQIMNELYHYVKGIWDNTIGNKLPIRKGMLVNFLKNKVPVNMIDQVINACVEADLIQKVSHVSGDIRYKPAPRPMMFGKPKA